MTYLNMVLLKLLSTHINLLLKSNTYLWDNNYLKNIIAIPLSRVILSEIQLYRRK